MTEGSPTPPANRPPTVAEIPIPKEVDEAHLAHQLRAAEGTIPFAERAITSRPRVELGLVRPMAPTYHEGAALLGFVSVDGKQHFRAFYAHQLTYLGRLRRPLADRGVVASERLEPSYTRPGMVAPGNEGHMIEADLVEEDETLVQITMICEEEATIFLMKDSDALRWSEETIDLYQRLSEEQREARMVKVNVTAKVAQVPIRRMAAEGKATAEDLGLSTAPSPASPEEGRRCGSSHQEHLAGLACTSSQG
jgi:hypothetical protein